MKKGIHPEYRDTVIGCACGEVIHTRSTRQNIKIDICSKCHPFFTGKQKLVDAAGMVDRFQKRFAKKREKKTKKIPAAPEAQSENKKEPAPESHE